MTTLADYTLLVGDLENGNFPTSFKDRNAKAGRLVHDICAVAWGTPEERSRAQGLVARLEWLRHTANGLSGSGGPGEAPAVPSPVKPPEPAAPEGKPEAVPARTARRPVARFARGRQKVRVLD